ncbi:Dam family site-specific DNA-(adenine-N6)-methyltransferase [Leisingera sp. ANG-S3]|uniref:Dam family site-specific DNA-(adenine-N6)-methyltransferase n=1 Tax=Leisingera sp. ANG-S3 TaxID=1577899 RepID=UPI00057C4599|nr:Dam family site-specific DNA-(adenine-N6)-methyltransferase [Leisingera sp. ANG-S3]KIC23214.1 DNA adenine methylase [Leisingera sp. ANG-S3]
MPVVPPIKSQGIKTKLVEWIGNCAAPQKYDRWVEPFMGTGVVAFNVRPKAALMCDSNPHMISFYKALQDKEIDGQRVRQFLSEEGAKLLATEGDHYYTIRERFNSSGNPLDFLFLSRSCFNGMMRFNRKGGFNVPFCKKPNRFAPALITKISNQVEATAFVIQNGDYEFRHQEFRDTLEMVGDADIVYCDPPYIGRHVDYFDSWTEEEEYDLHDLLNKCGASYIMSTWLKNRYRENEYVFSLWKDCTISTKEHFYHVGAKEANRNAVYEALLTNFPTQGGKRVSELDLANIAPESSKGSLMDNPKQVSMQI